MTLPQHLSISNEYFTPPDILEASRNTLNTIHLDPASNKVANQRLVKAKDYFNKEQDGLSRDWYGNVFLNPPGGKVNKQSSQKVWLEKLINEWKERRVNEAIFCAFNLEIIRLVPASLQFPFCIPKDRPKYWSICPYTRELKEGQWSEKQQKWTNSPSHATVILYLPSLDNSLYSMNKFSRSFSCIGTVYEGSIAWN